MKPGHPKTLTNDYKRNGTTCLVAIEGYIEHRNANDSRPARWSKEPEELVEAWRKGHQKLQ